MNEIRQFVQAIIMFRDAHDNEWPETLTQTTGYLESGLKKKIDDYLYARPDMDPMNSGATTKILFEKLPVVSSGQFVGFADGHVEFVRDSPQFEKSPANDSLSVRASLDEFQFRWVAAEDDTNSPVDILVGANGQTATQTFRILHAVVLSSPDVESAGFSQYQGEQKTLEVFLNPRGREKLARATAQNIHRQLAIVWRGKVICAPIIQSEIPNGRVAITGRFSDAEAQQLLDVLNHRASVILGENSSTVFEPPNLQFLAWQDEWKTNQPGAARHPDGSPVTDATELKWLREVRPGSCFESAQDRKPELRFVHLWFSHPLFDQAIFSEVTLLDEQGRTIQPDVGSCTSRADGRGWFTYTLSPGEGANIPSRVTVQLRYAVGPLERTQEIEVTPKTRNSMALEGNSQLNGVGQNVDGQAFVSLAVDATKMKARRFGVIAVTKDGRELVTGGSWSGNGDGTGVRVEEYDFNIPLAEVAKFIIGTRPIRTNEWKNVVLPGK